jgi:tetratricopeptide (TPR) repeat protein
VRALAVTERDESDSPDDPWVHYDRAVALEVTGAVDGAVGEFQDAESAFAGEDRHGKAISIYGRAHALASAGRCRDASAAYQEYATFVRREAPQKADMALQYAKDCIEPLPVDPVAEAAASAVVAGNYAGALAMTPKGGSAWVEYDRAVAFDALHRTDDAVASFQRAELAFGDAARWERSIAVYGRARALANGFRCVGATRAYDEYAALVRATNPRDAELATTYARDCHAAYRW